MSKTKETQDTQDIPALEDSKVRKLTKYSVRLLVEDVFKVPDIDLHPSLLKVMTVWDSIANDKVKGSLTKTIIFIEKTIKDAVGLEIDLERLRHNLDHHSETDPVMIKKIIAEFCHYVNLILDKNAKEKMSEEELNLSFISFPPPAAELVCPRGTYERLVDSNRELRIDRSAASILKIHNVVVRKMVEKLRISVLPEYQVHIKPYIDYLLGFTDSKDSWAQSQISAKSHLQILNQYHQEFKDLLTAEINSSPDNLRAIHAYLEEFFANNENFKKLRSASYLMESNVQYQLDKLKNIDDILTIDSHNVLYHLLNDMNNFSAGYSLEAVIEFIEVMSVISADGKKFFGGSQSLLWSVIGKASRTGLLGYAQQHFDNHSNIPLNLKKKWEDINQYCHKFLEEKKYIIPFTEQNDLKDYNIISLLSDGLPAKSILQAISLDSLYKWDCFNVLDIDALRLECLKISSRPDGSVIAKALAQEYLQSLTPYSKKEHKSFGVSFLNELMVAEIKINGVNSEVVRFILDNRKIADGYEIFSNPNILSVVADIGLDELTDIIVDQLIADGDIDKLLVPLMTCDVDITVSNENHCLMDIAARSGNIYFIKKLLAIKPEMESAIFAGKSLSRGLHIALENHHIEFFRFVVGLHQDLNFKYDDGTTIAFSAVVNNNVEAIKILGEAGMNKEYLLSSVERMNQDNQPFVDNSLLQAIEKRNTESIQALAEAGLDASSFNDLVLDDDGCRKTAIFVAINYSTPEILTMLTTFGTDINKLSPVKAKNDTILDLRPIEYAILSGNNDFIRPIIAAGADLTSSSQADNILDLILSRQENEDLIDNFLISKNKENGNGFLHQMAAINPELIPHDALAINLEKVINIRNKAGETPISIAAKAGNIDFIKYLAKTNFNIDDNIFFALASVSDMTDENFQTFSAALIESGADIDYQNSNSGNSALHMASRLGKADVVKKLLALGVSPQLKNANQKGAADVANGLRKDEILDMIRTAMLDYTTVEDMDDSSLIDETNLDQMDFGLDSISEEQPEPISKKRSFEETSEQSAEPVSKRPFPDSSNDR